MDNKRYYTDKHEGNGVEKRTLLRSDLANEPGLGSSRTYQPGEMPLQTKTRPGLRRLHQKMTSQTARSISQLRAAVPPKRARVEEEVKTIETMRDLNETKEELERMRKTLLRKKGKIRRI